ncbi:MAG: hypothetical protein CMJ78_25035 [Planctomycetaceae bacterium]|nr:hypothetical protein [Planctomycetaceae bacterium]
MIVWCEISQHQQNTQRIVVLTQVDFGKEVRGGMKPSSLIGLRPKLKGLDDFPQGQIEDHSDSVKRGVFSGLQV